MGRKVLAALAAMVTLATVSITIVASPAAAAVSLPPGFVQTSRFSGQTSQPLTAFALLPDGGLLTAGKGGNVTWVAPDDSEFRRLAQLPVRNIQDIGLVGLAVAPDYATSGILFTGYAYTDANGDGFHRLSQWSVDDVSSPRSLRNEKVILDRITVGPSNVHGLTEIVAAADGTLWVSIGDGAIWQYADPLALQALNLDGPHGKVLHIHRDGRGVADNPYYNAAAPSSWRSRVYASGFRSPFRFTIDPRSGAPVVADVGWNSYEEINVLRPGASYGWPCWEGPERTPGYRDMPGCAGVGHTAPTYAYPRGEGVSVTGGVFYEGQTWPEQYRGTYMFGDYGSKRLWTARIGTDGKLTTAPVRFGSDIGGPVHFRTASNGDILYANIFNGRIVRLSYTPGNRTPTPVVTTRTDPATRTVQFDGSESSDLDGDELSWTWDLGDQTPAKTGPRVSHTYGAGETFTAVLTLKDSAGASVQHPISVAPGNHEPSLAVQEATGSGPGGTFAVGDPVQLTATARDQEDGDLEVTWHSALVHCRGTSCHDHEPKTTTGPSYDTVFDDHGGDTRLVVKASAKDSAGATSVHQFVARPSLRRLTVSASTPAVVTLNGIETAEALVTEGSTSSVSVPATATDGVATFARWENGSTGRARTVQVGAQDVTLTAIYATPIDRRYASDPAVRSTVGKPVSPEQGSTDLRWRDYERGRLYWTPRTDVRVLSGAIKDTYLRLGAHVTQGVPLTDEQTTPDGTGRYVHFDRAASIYWTPGTGAHAVGGAIRQRWAALGWERGPMGYPVTSELATPDGVGRFNHFSKGASIYWTPGTGAQGVWGAIRQRWESLGWENGPMGYPVSTEAIAPDGVGRYNHFSRGGSIYWTPSTGAHGVWGAIRQRWAVLGWERSYLGYPTTTEFAVPGGRRSNFQRGYVTWTASTGAVHDRRY